MAEPIVSLSGVHKYYGDYHALRGIDLDIAQGDFFSLLGPSGCGKTTLLRVIAGFEDVTEGTVLLGGQNMAGVQPNRRPTNMVFQSYAIFPHLTVAQNVGFGLRRKSDLDAKTKKMRAEEALEMVGLKGYGARAAHALSAANDSVSPWRARLCCNPKCCCWTSRCPRSTRRCASRCRSS